MNSRKIQNKKIELIENLVFKSFLLLILFFNACTEAKLKETNQPNIILFLVDDLGWKDLSSYGSELYKTPNADALAKEGVLFTNAYSAATVCSPTRASILTGKYPATLNCTDWIKGHQRPYAKYQIPDWKMYLDPEETTLAETLKDKGYRTAHIGKWHLGEEEKYWPENQGFDINIGGWSKGSPQKIKKKGGYFVPYNNPLITDGPEGEYLTERLAKEAENYIKTNKTKPFFMNFWLYSVHTPLQAKIEKINKYDSVVNPENLQSNATYAAMIEHMDDALGTVIKALKEAKVYENTIIVFASDNGGLIGNKGNLSTKPKVTSNYPLRSGKGDMYEGGVRVPFIVSWPKKIKGNRVTNVLSISPDISPTVLGLIGGEIKGLQAYDGENLSPFLLKNKKPNRNTIFWHYPHYHTEGASPYSAVRQGDWKLIKIFEGDSLKLYNLAKDIGEKQNLNTQYPEKVKMLLNVLNDWKKRVGAQEPIKNKNFNTGKQNIWKNEWGK